MENVIEFHVHVGIAISVQPTQRMTNPMPSEAPISRQASRKIRSNRSTKSGFHVHAASAVRAESVRMYVQRHPTTIDSSCCCNAAAAVRAGPGKIQNNRWQRQMAKIGRCPKQGGTLAINAKDKVSSNSDGVRACASCCRVGPIINPTIGAGKKKSQTVIFYLVGPTRKRYGGRSNK